MNSNASPGAGGPPTSFKTNVNRAKTKRWVEAKSYSYDGDDWGEVDDYDEYGGYDTGPPQRATGLRQQGQSPASSAGVFQGQEHMLQSPVETQEQTYIAPGGQPSQLQQEYGGQSAFSSQAYHQPIQGRKDAFISGDERRTFSAGAPQYMGTSVGLAGQVPVQQDQALLPGSSQLRMPAQGPQMYQQPTQNRSRPSMEGQQRTLGQGPPPTGYRGVSYTDRPRQPGDGSRTQSMTSSISSQEIYNRRDFSPSAMPQPLHTQSRETPPRKSSLSQNDTPKVANDSFQPQTSAQATIAAYPDMGSVSHPPDSEDRADSNVKPLPFVRPADIYKRMAEEKAKERQSQESSRPTMEAITSGQPLLPRDTSPGRTAGRASIDNPRGVPVTQRSFEEGDDNESYSRTKSMLDPVVERKSEYGMEGMDSVDLAPGIGSSHEAGAAQPQPAVPVEHDSSGSPRLPDVPRMSGFGESFMGSMSSTYGNLQNPGPVEHIHAEAPQSPVYLSAQDGPASALQHQPSQGFRTVVSKAFEDQVPPTPTSTTGSAVERSNSESTSDISPIVSRVPSAVTPETRMRQADTRHDNIPIIAEESTVGTPRPNSQDTIAASKPLARKPSPSQGLQLDSSIPVLSPVIPGHRRNLSTPSPDNSPARTPAVEMSQQLRQPQEAELAVTTPTSMTHNSSTGSNVMPRTADKILEDSTVPQSASYTDAKVAPTAGSTISRADSPSKSRVRDLADRFENRDLSRQASNSSLRASSASPKTGNAENDLPSRPPADRLESFRPHLPGGWDSYASNAPASSGLSGFRSQTQDFASDEQVNNAALGPSALQQQHDETIKSGDQHANESESKIPGGISDESMDITPTTDTRTLSKASEQPSISDPFSAVAAAGAALAGAFTAAVGFDQEGSEDEQPSMSQAARPDDSGAARARSTSLRNSAFHPEASKPWMFQDDESASSVAPTPLDIIPDQGNHSDNPNYFSPVVPLKQRPYPIETVNETTPSRPQILPTMSTETSPNDYESDRLRKQLVRELSPHLEHFPEDQLMMPSESQRDESGLSTSPSMRRQEHDSMFLPQEYESYWNGSNNGDSISHRGSHQDTLIEGSTSTDMIGNTAVGTLPFISGETPRVSTEPAQNPIHSNNAPQFLGVRPNQLTHRFSWEPVPEEINAPLQDGTSGDASEKETFPDHSPNASALKQNDTPRASLGPSDVDKEVFEELPNVDKKLPQIMNPVPDIQSRSQDNDRSENHVEEPAGNTPLPPLPTDPATIPSFRAILALKDPTERIQTYKATREQFAHMNTGLNQWLIATMNDLPEHSDLLSNGGVFGNISGHRPSPSRTKFPGLRVTSGQSLQQQPHQQHLGTNSQMMPPSPNSSAAINSANSSGYSPGSSSGRISGQQMQAKGKDLLHSAGLFGGKANTAAKGLFSKGRSKFRGSGSVDKATPQESSAHIPSPSQEMPMSYQPHISDQNQGTSLLVFPDRSVISLYDTGSKTAPRQNNQSRPVSSALTHGAENLGFSDGRVSPLLSGYSKGQERKAHNVPRLSSDASSGLIQDSSTSRTTPLMADSSLHDSHNMVQNPARYGSLPTGDTGSELEKSAPNVAAQENMRDGVHSPMSASSSNRTPTQADFANGTLHREIYLPPSPSPGLISPVLANPQSSTERTFSEIPTSNFVRDSSLVELATTRGRRSLPEKDQSSLPQENFSWSSSVDTRDTQHPPSEATLNVVTPPRASEDSEGTYHTADSGEEFQMRPGSVTLAMSRAQTGQTPQNAVNTSFKDLHKLALPKSLAEDSATNREALDSPSRPFSFISFGQIPDGDLTLRNPIIDSNRDKVPKRLTLALTSPQQPLSSQEIQNNHAHYDTNYDFIPGNDDQNLGAPRPRSFSRPFQDPNVRQHPAFRQNEAVDKTADVPVQYYPPQVRRDEAMIAQGTEYQLEGLGPPPAETNGKARSRRSSRSSAFFKNFILPSEQEVPPIPHSNERQAIESPSTSPLNPAKKKKRASLFRSLTGHTGSDSSRSGNNSVAPPAISQMNTQPRASSRSPARERQRSFTSPPIKPKTKGSRNKLQRASMSGVPEQEKGKKKRFSGLGVSRFGCTSKFPFNDFQSLFGQSSPKQQPAVTPTIQPAFRRNSSQQHTPVPQRSSDSQSQQHEPMPSTGHGSAYHTNHQSYSRAVPPPGYDIPPLEGYYSPDRISGSFSPEGINDQRLSLTMAQNPVQYEEPPIQYPAESQQSHYQPQSPWVRNLMSHSPTPNPRSYPGQNSSREAPDYYNEHRSLNDLSTSNEPWPNQLYPTSQHPIPSYRGQNESGIALVPPRGASIVRESQGYHEAPPVRYDSPPPPPPPKDDHLLQGSRSRHGRSLSQIPPPTEYSPSTSRQGAAQTRQSLPPLQTNVGKARVATASTPMTPEDVRRARQQQIERSGRMPPAQARNDDPITRHDPEEEIVMSSSSYPGQEWQPSYGNWDGD
ncbi:hypothetical protein MMC17_003907 [Xylographa soralifera]|nr:hypothetical protein [Xylographa soralifera]